MQWAEVQRLEAAKNYVLVYPAGQSASYPLRGSLAHILDQLVPAALRPQFLRVSRRLYLNAAYITSYDSAYIYYGPVCYENDQLAQQQLATLRLS